MNLHICADRAKCHGIDCAVRERCRRYLAPAHPTRQTWVQPWIDPESGCDLLDPIPVAQVPARGSRSSGYHEDA